MTKTTIIAALALAVLTGAAQAQLFSITQESYELCVAKLKAARQENIALCVKQNSDAEACRVLLGTTPADNCRPPPRNSK
jgi:hypothetical protein